MLRHLVETNLHLSVQNSHLNIQIIIFMGEIVLGIITIDYCNGDSDLWLALSSTSYFT